MINKIKKLFRFNTPVLPTAYSESLSYYEDIQLLINKIDECVDAINNFVVPDGSSTPIADNIAKYDEGGRLKTNEPSTDLDCVNLKYFNENGGNANYIDLTDLNSINWRDLIATCVGADLTYNPGAYTGTLYFTADDGILYDGNHGFTLRKGKFDVYALYRGMGCYNYTLSYLSADGVMYTTLQEELGTDNQPTIILPRPYLNFTVRA